MLHTRTAQALKGGKAKTAKPKPRKGSVLEAKMAEQIQDANLPPCESEYRFHPTRMWRFDFCFVEQKIAVEVEGGTWVKGAHGRGKHYERDCIKYNAATQLGYRVFRFTTDMVSDGRAIETLKEALKGETNADTAN